MRSRRMKVAPFLIIALLGIRLRGAPAQGQYTLSGHITVDAPARAQTQAPAAIPLMGVRLYFPKQSGPQQARQPALLTHTDSAGDFKFVNLPVDSYLLEIYLGDRMLYQKLVTLRGDVKLEIHLGDVLVTEKIRLEQRHRKILTDPEFQGKVTVYVGDIHKTKPFALLIFLTGPERSRWQDSSRISPDQIRAAVPKANILFDGTLSPPSKLEANFIYNRQSYTLVGSLQASLLGKDYLDFDVHRPASKETGR